MTKGAVAYDVREMKGDPVYDSSHGDPEMIIDGKFNPYGQDQQATDSMAFNHTELTPAKIEADMTTPSTWQELNGYSPGSIASTRCHSNEPSFARSAPATASTN